MVLTKDQIESGGLIEQGNPNSMRPIGYDLRIGRVLAADGKGQVNEGERWTLKPQEIVTIISTERVKIPNDVVGYAKPKTQWCFKGISVLNTGVLDPGYEGPIAATVINFSKQPLVLRKDGVFLRLVFHKIGSAVTPDVKKVADDAYLNDRIADTAQYPTTFLDLPTQVDQIAHQVVQRESAHFMKFLAVASVLFAIVAIAVPLLSSGISKDEKPAAITVDKMYETMLQNNLRYESEITRLQEQLRTLQEKVAEKQPPESSTR